MRKLLQTLLIGLLLSLTLFLSGQTADTVYTSNGDFDVSTVGTEATVKILGGAKKTSEIIANKTGGDGENGLIVNSYSLFAPCSSLTLAVGDVIQPQCFGGNDGFISVVVTGGNTPYSFSWEDDLLNTDSTRTGLEAGSYKV